MSRHSVTLFFIAFKTILLACNKFSESDAILRMHVYIHNFFFYSAINNCTAFFVTLHYWRCVLLTHLDRIMYTIVHIQCVVLCMHSYPHTIRAINVIHFNHSGDTLLRGNIIGVNLRHSYN